MTLDQIDTTKFLEDPKKKSFIKNLVKRSNVFDFNIEVISNYKCLVYITLMYDKESYFRKDIKNFSQRKFEAALCAGIQLQDDGTFDERYENVLIGNNDFFNRAVVQYVAMQYNLEYAKLVVYEHNYYKLIAASFQQFNPTGKKLIDDLESEINALEHALFGGQETMNARRALYEGTSRSKLNIRPEEINEQRAIDQLRHLSPWGKHDLSKATEVNFVGDEIPKTH